MDVTIYTTSRCPMCVSAKMWLRERQIEYTEVSLDDPSVREEFKSQYPNARTVPQIFLGTNHIGGFSDLVSSNAFSVLNR